MTDERLPFQDDEAATLPDPPAAPRIDGAWQWGRYRAPFADPDLHIDLSKRFRLKEWHYTSVSTPRLFLAFGLVQLGYIANAFLYVVDRRRPDVAREYAALSMLGRALHFAPSSVAGESRWRRRGTEIRVGHVANAWHVRLDVELPGSRLRGGFRMQSGESLALLYDLGNGRPAYTHKAAGLGVRGSVILGDESIDLAGGYGTLDWTRSLAERETRWKWASFAGSVRAGSHDRVLGLNLSSEIYDVDGVSRENAFWCDGRVTPLGSVHFDVPENAGVDDWTLRSDDRAVDLTFRPLGARAQHLDLKLIRSDFVQPYGTFQGQVCGHDVDEMFGVVEDHLSVW